MQTFMEISISLYGQYGIDGIDHTDVVLGMKMREPLP
jgi:hypothetical protein